MNRENFTNHLGWIVSRLLGIGFIFVFSIAGLAQNGVQHNDYKADQTLRSNARVNPSTLAMELSLPLAVLPGRAGNSVPVGINYSSKVWDFRTLTVPPDPQIASRVLPRYSTQSAAGWSSTLNIPRIDYDQYEREIYYSGEDGNVQAYILGTSPDNVALYYVKRVRVVMAGGASVEFRKDDAVHPRGQPSEFLPTDRSGTFLAVDGSRMRLEMGTPDTVLYLADGGRYIFAAASALAHTFIDRHGNQMTLSETQTVDTLGRTIINPISLVFNPNQVLQTAGTKSYFYSGIGSATREFKLIWGQLDTVLDASQTLKNLGDYNCGYSPPTFVGNALFESLGFRVCGGHSLSNPVVLTEVQLPNGAAYRFKYNSYGEITRIDYPTGGYERFEYGYLPPVASSTSPYGKANRGVKFRWVSEGGTGATERMWKYEAERTITTYKYLVRMTEPDLSYSEQLLHDEPDDAPNVYGFSNAFVGRAYEERVYTAGNVLLRRKLTGWTQTGSLTINGVAGYSGVTRDLRPQKEVSIIFELGATAALAQMSETEYDTGGNGDPQYFSSLNAKQSKTYHYKVLDVSTAQNSTIDQISALFSSANLGTMSEVDYLYDANYKARNITGLPTETRVKDASGAVKAKSQISYDEAVYPLINAGTVSQWQDPNTNYRGNVTTTKSWTDIAANQFVETHAQYDNFGNLRKSWDAKGNLSEVEYSSNYNYAYPTKTISPIADTSGVNGSNTAFETTTSFDFTTGLPLSSTDANGQTSTIEYNDALLRPTRSVAPNGWQTITEYGAGTSAATRFVKVRTQIDATNWQEGYSWYDGIGRAIKAQAIDSAGDVFTETEYDNMGRAKKATNPYRTGETKLWTESFYDDLGRVTKLKTPDLAEVLTAYSLATTGANIGTVVTVTDQALKQRRSITNSLGQLTRVDEPNDAGQLGTIDTPTQPTLYSYDTLNNLINVNQGTAQLPRTFQYDALSRLKSAANPEAGTINYAYDNSGNLTSKTDGRNITTSYVYDNLNRVKTRSYNDGTTPQVNYFYDNLLNAKGKLIKVSSLVSMTEYTSFDILGRVLAHKQTTDGTAYTTAYSYNLSGALLEETYPSGRKVKNTLDTDGDLSLVETQSSGGGWQTRANNFTYTAAGAVSSMQLGNGRWESTVFNTRLQPTQIALGTAQNGTDKLKLNFDYGTTANNGNVLSQTITVPSGFTATQTYTYDSLNRLKSATEMIGTQTWKQTFLYDRYGNRNFDVVNTTTLGSCPQAQCNPTIDTANNRFTSGQGYTYDLAGNIITDAQGRTFTYDGENKQKEVKDVNNISIGQYFYDGDGKRVKKFIFTTQETTRFVYDAAGQLLEEYVNQSSQPQVSNIYVGGRLLAVENPSATSYLTTDHLGSPRITTDTSGNVISRRDFLPFGEEIYTAQRTSGLNYTTDNTRQKFTAYERDNESDLDYAQARYYNPKHGRFTAIDPLMASARKVNPQTFNRYSYVTNNPLNLIDPLGLSGCDPKTDPNCAEQGPNGTPVQLGNGGTPGVIATVTIAASQAAVAIETTAGQISTQISTRVLQSIPSFAATGAELLSVPGMIFMMPMQTARPSCGVEVGTVCAGEPEHQPNTQPQIEPFPIPPTTTGTPGDPVFVRFGPGPESLDGLREQAEAAEASGFPYGVSTFLLTPPIRATDARTAPVPIVNGAFEVRRTGNKPNHYTVIFPKPLTQETVNLFNTVFTPR